MTTFYSGSPHFQHNSVSVSAMVEKVAYLLAATLCGGFKYLNVSHTPFQVRLHIRRMRETGDGGMLLEHRHLRR